MRKYKCAILSIVVGVIVIFIGYRVYSDIDFSIPKLKVYCEENNSEFWADTNGGNWFSSYGGNSFDLGDYDFKRLNEIETREFPKGSLIEFEFSHNVQFKNIELYLINGDSIENTTLEKVNYKNNKFYASEKEGTYGYVLDTYLDDTHNIRFIFKLKCV
ncbi:MAG: hypothetical protein ACRCVJ_15215 [Clostridium sp.]|uniref:hypothetical protein n=1 Tax=Clostridium sp. TaxID=1506 RepID=UPI003F2D4E90